MSGSEKKWYSRGSTKDRKDREKEKGKYTGQKDPSSHGQQSGSGSKGGGGHGQKKSGGYDGPAHMNPITITSTSTAAANTKVCLALSCVNIWLSHHLHTKSF